MSVCGFSLLGLKSIAKFLSQGRIFWHLIYIYNVRLPISRFSDVSPTAWMQCNSYRSITPLLFLHLAAFSQLALTNVTQCQPIVDNTIGKTNLTRAWMRIEVSDLDWSRRWSHFDSTNLLSSRRINVFHKWSCRSNATYSRKALQENSASWIYYKPSDPTSNQ